MMDDPIAELRLSVFIAVLALMVIWELLAVRRAGAHRAQRWPGNVLIVVLEVLLLQLLFPLAAVGAALYSSFNNIGLFHYIDIPIWWKMIIAFFVLDLAVYLQHRLFHRVPILWRLHRMHHTDTAIDVTTGVRFHPIEIILSMLIKWGVILAIGAPIYSVIAFELVLNACALFNHSNVKMPMAVDRFLRGLIVTPDMHRVHHSTSQEEHNSNFGVSVPWWDWLFASYQAQPKAGHLDMEIGLEQFRDSSENRVDRLLTQPFR
jgi:sterol desaturase/sphingolipid hydroxylase (fatty acid hydroxylase superfamily)